MMQIVFFYFFQKAEEFYIKGAWAKDTEWIGPIWGLVFPQFADPV